MAMTKSEIDSKRQNIIDKIRAEIKEMHSILKLMGEVPGIADNGDANILINTILMRIDSSERDIKVFQLKDDGYIERYDEKSYFKFMEDKIAFFRSRYEFYSFNASLRRPYCSAKGLSARKLKKAEIQKLISGEKVKKVQKAVKEEKTPVEQKEVQPGE